MELRFEFGKNWANYSRDVTEENITNAAISMKTMLGVSTLEQKKFLDIGSGSGLFSLAAHRLGATIFSFDYDNNSVATTEKLKKQFAPGSQNWTIQHGSVLDDSYMRGLGNFDVVYSWGVLHHTGSMWKALEYAILPLNKGGQLFISIYNDQGGTSKRWAFIKRTYNRMPFFIKPIMIFIIGIYFTCKFMVARILNFKNPLPFKDWAKDLSARGMRPWNDLVDWTGGYPFEVAKPDDIIDFYVKRGFTLQKLKTVGSGHGCNEYVFRRN